MFERFKPLYLNRIDLWVEECASTRATVEAAQEKRFTLDRLEKHYGKVDLHPRSGVPSPVTRLLELLQKKPRGPYGAIVFSQSYPDLEPLSAPLQRCLEFHPMVARDVIGLSHLEDTAGLEAMVCLDWLLDEAEEGLVLLTDILPYQHQKDAGTDIVACLELSRKSGAVKIEGVTRERNFPARAESLRMCDPWLAFAEGCDTRKFLPGEGVLLNAGTKSLSLSLELITYPIIQHHRAYQAPALDAARILAV